MQDKQNTNNTNYKVILAWLAILAIVWLLWSGLYKPLVLALGVVSCLLTIYISYRSGFFRESTALHVLPRIPGYWFKLFIAIVKSSIDVTRIVLNPKLPISPTVVKLDALPKGQIGQAILGNSITLTPGTVTIDVHKGQLSIHCLTQDGAKDILASDINQKTAELTDK
ncbi:MAG: Na+/H+ antiporter subunit E [Gammaproteobacteria bacterium]|nr:Na+/H+ antiporter subunit E [Gammaproteobacteria bacterium]NNJ73197.1 Na+/H+ antiporter subunit E [Enterobacterales bacterium]